MCTASEKYGCKENLGQSQIQSPPYDFDSSECRKIIHPEEDMGVRVAQSLSYPMVSRYMSLEDDHYIVKIEIHANHHDTPLRQLMNQVPEIKVLLHKRGTEIQHIVDLELLLKEGDILVVEGLLEPLRRLSKHFKAI